MVEPDDIQRVPDRVVALEEWMMHTDRLLASLNEVVCALQDRLAEQSRKLETLSAAIHRLAFPEEKRSFEDERPPHY